MNIINYGELGLLLYVITHITDPLALQLQDEVATMYEA